MAFFKKATSSAVSKALEMLGRKRKGNDMYANPVSRFTRRTYRGRMSGYMPATGRGK